MRTALIVDDNSDIRFLLSQVLKMEGYEVVLAENGKVAQEKLLKGKPPMIVLLDLMMPVMDGWQFLSWKNEHPSYSDIPVLVISAMQLAEVPEGTVGYLRKPIDIKDVIKTVDAIS